VITIPADFTSTQRDETFKAAELKGLQVLRVITELAAAAIAFVRQTKFAGKKTVLV
jgi:molecular chaperone DnaK (HSP70)